MEEETLRDLCRRLANTKVNSAWNLFEVHFFYIDEQYSLFISKDGGSHQEGSIRDHSSVKSVGFDRGELLEIFSKLEFLVDECLRVHFLGLGSTKNFEYLTQYIDMGHRVKTLYKEGLITKSLSTAIPNILHVRNQIAHTWQFKDIMYQEKNLEDYDHFVMFKNDMEHIFSEIINTYQCIMKKNDVEKYVKKLILEIEENS